MITNYDPEAEQKCFVMVQQNKADGVIALTYSPDLQVDDSIPIVTIDRHFGGSVPCVCSDNYRGGEIAAEKLLELGCRKLLFLRIGPDVAGEADKRCNGFENACRQHSAEYDKLLVHDSETVSALFRFLDGHLRDGKLDYDGIFCNTDWLAVRILRHLEERGVDVPGQVQIIGFDGVVDYATGRCGCSTIEQPLAQIAEAAVGLLLNPSSTSAGATVCLPVRYIPGGTTRG